MTKSSHKIHISLVLYPLSKDNNNDVGAPLPKNISTYSNPQGTTKVVPFPIFREYFMDFMLFL